MDNGITLHSLVGHFLAPNCNFNEKISSYNYQLGLGNLVNSRLRCSGLAIMLRRAFNSGKVACCRPVWKSNVTFGKG